MPGFSLRGVSLFFVLFIWSCTSHDAVPGHDALRLSDGKIVSFGEMIDDLGSADIIFVGEVHDNIGDHVAEYDIISALHGREVPFGIGLEMFRADSQKGLDDWINGSLDQDRFIRLYYNNWKMPWPYYGDVLLYAREHSLPLVGLNVPDAIGKKVATKGFASLTPAELAELPPGISCSVDHRYMDFIKRIYQSHGTKNDSFVHFCEAQMVWDKSMAWHLLAYMKKHPRKKMVVLAGIGHAWKRGIPEQVRQNSSFTVRVVLPRVPGEANRASVTSADADYIFID